MWFTLKKIQWKGKAGAALDLAFLSRFERFNFYLVFLRSDSISLTPFDCTVSLAAQFHGSAFGSKHCFEMFPPAAAQFICFGRVILRPAKAQCAQGSLVGSGVLWYGECSKPQGWKSELKSMLFSWEIHLLLCELVLALNLLLITISDTAAHAPGCLFTSCSELITVKNFPSEDVWCEHRCGYALAA